MLETHDVMLQNKRWRWWW